MIARKNVQNLKGGNETRGQVRRRLKFRPIFCPFFSFSLLVLPLWLPFSLSHTRSVRSPLILSLRSRTRVYFRIIPLRRRLQSHPHRPPRFFILSLPCSRQTGNRSHGPRPPNVRPRMYAHPFVPSLAAPLLIHLSRIPPSHPPFLPRPRLTGRVLFPSYLSRFPYAEIWQRENELSLLIPWRLSSPSAVPPELIRCAELVPYSAFFCVRWAARARARAYLCARSLRYARMYSTGSSTPLLAREIQ